MSFPHGLRAAAKRLGSSRARRAVRLAVGALASGARSLVAGFRRLVAQHCLYGVDVNPMAVQLGRLSLWLCSIPVLA